mgnify:CR=1 FL=1
MNVKENDSKYIANTYARFPVVITGGKGSLLYDENGKEYIDLTRDPAGAIKWLRENLD